VAVSIRQVAGSSTAATFLAHVPSDATVVLSSGSAATVAWGPGTSVTFTTGALFSTTPFVFRNPSVSAGFDIYVITGTGTATVSATVVTAG
jgi:hypothetical protein